ncbi:hypothetical protein ELH42_32650 (plasmid) [Rhizobium ruizarguesonis]|uniref:hypothetical protein n=1 Tax=Rhizobium ruizarguesonis TaxID=2081791 RepID=UPI00103224EA|nr:hypothetical protein [Rhizobium ruizarguesonis]TBB58960.1 hypothetical protein ELH42_32650 [Rhizobium ruizarguesonis]
MSVIAAVVVSEKIILVEGVLNGDKTVTIVKDEPFDLEKGDRQLAYAVMHKRVKDRLSQGIDQVLLKASAGGRNPATSAILHAAELRGVFLSAVPDGIPVRQLQKNALSRNFGSRKVDEYLKDDAFFGENFDGVNLRKGSREAAFLLLSAR